MKNSAHDITTYVFAPDEGLLIDANVWLVLYGPQGNPPKPKTQIYSSALKSILAAKSRIYLDILVMSEFVNACARFEYDRQPVASKPASFKAFRDSAAFQPIAKGIAAACRKLEKHCERLESQFSTVDISAILAEYENCKADFNDLVLAELCKSKGLSLVTHDGDFKDRGLTLISANPKLLT